ncbi:MAG: hypothetical protein HY432_02685 [Candidatus Liptonbacteria bacterium]|nr:hypothetical protein [Candidatus Liptonbacteria bacterium]
MEPIELLKKFKNLEPDPDYTKRSRNLILSNGRWAGFPVSMKEITMGIFKSGWSIALTAAMLLLAVGSFSALKIFSPVRNSVVDITGLKAEAEAIDAQIELGNVVYTSALGIENKTSTTSIASPKATVKISPPAKTENIGQESGEEGTSTEPTIDSVLDALSQ